MDRILRVTDVVFGIIIDTFAELRESNAFIKHHMENYCFICGIDRFTFETKGAGFVPHIKQDHNMWHYMFLMIYLRDKDPTEYNGWEQVADAIAITMIAITITLINTLCLMTVPDLPVRVQHVANQMKAGETAFFPSNKAIVLLSLQEQEAADEVRKAQRVEQMAQDSTYLVHAVEQIQKALDSSKENAERVERLEAKMERLSTSVETLVPPVVEAETVRVRR